ncbi:hypothetical protein MRX96_003674 [Rhipicephalus microplus]
MLRNAAQSSTTALDQRDVVGHDSLLLPQADPETTTIAARGSGGRRYLPPPSRATAHLAVLVVYRPAAKTRAPPPTLPALASWPVLHLGDVTVTEAPSRPSERTTRARQQRRRAAG